MTFHYPPQTQQLLDLLGIKRPLIQAPMVGVSNPQLAAAVAAAGALGSLGLGGGSPSGIAQAQTLLAGLTNRPVNLNFFAHARPQPDRTRETAWLARLAPHFARLNAPAPKTLQAPYGSFDDNPETLEALLAIKPAVVSFHFGLPAAAAVKALKANRCLIMGTATCAAEAALLEQGGADLIIAQGWEAGGHRGCFTARADTPDEQLGTFALVPEVCAAVTVPVVAAGGINTGSAAAAALALGAAGVQLGTAFVSCPESSASQAYRQALQNQQAQTVMTAVFSGREARGLSNVTIRSLQAHADLAPDYPIAYSAAKALAAAAESTGNEQWIMDYSPLWAGQAFRSNRAMPAAALVETIADELEQALRR